MSNGMYKCVMRWQAVGTICKVMFHTPQQEYLTASTCNTWQDPMLHIVWLEPSETSLATLLCHDFTRVVTAVALQLVACKGFGCYSLASFATA